MREIKFRVWDKKTKKMFTGFHLFGEMTLVGGIHAWQHEEGEAIGIKRDTLGALNDLIEMQYIGLKDKNGKEIYEGDIVKDSTGLCTVNWHNIFASFCIDRDGWAYSHFFNEAAKPDEVEVIGNIYENPELI